MFELAPSATVAHLHAVFGAAGWASSTPLLERVSHDVADAFLGRWPGYLAIDMRYHDLGHTLQATVCIADLAAGLVRSGEVPEFGQRYAELGVIAALLHDSGFLKYTGDTAGTGAKYTLVHEERSCVFARAYLPRVGLTPNEIAEVCGAISCTGPRNRISAHTFPTAVARKLACLLVTADYVAQISAPNYPDKLEFLFAEFTEAFDYAGIPVEKRPYASAEDLKRRTPDFWQKFVRPMLADEADGVHRYLAGADGVDPYWRAIEDNIAEIQRRNASPLVET